MATFGPIFGLFTRSGANKVIEDMGILPPAGQQTVIAPAGNLKLIGYGQATLYWNGSSSYSGFAYVPLPGAAGYCHAQITPMSSESSMGRMPIPGFSSGSGSVAIYAQVPMRADDAYLPSGSCPVGYLIYAAS